jgi:hypothetical protein
MAGDSRGAELSRSFRLERTAVGVVIIPAVRWLRKQRSVYEEVLVGLSRDEALVLDALFTRHRDENRPLVPSDDAEKSALIGLGAAIEGAILDDVRSEDYRDRVNEARKRLAEAEQPEEASGEQLET